jgi:hypothetical protein
MRSPEVGPFEMRCREVGARTSVRSRPPRRAIAHIKRGRSFSRASAFSRVSHAPVAPFFGQHQRAQKADRFNRRELSCTTISTCLCPGSSFLYSIKNTRPSWANRRTPAPSRNIFSNFATLSRRSRNQTG